MPEIYWTKHSEAKIKFYHFSKQRVQRVLHTPKRIEEGIAPNTIAVMQVAGSQKHPYEIWVMVQEKRQVKRDKQQVITKIISAWKYPGRTKPGEPLPEEILREIKESL
jgi:hypothetical protein